MMFGDVSTMCKDLYSVLHLVGIILTIFKVAIPLIIIVLGIIDLGKAAISQKPEEIKKSGISLAWRVGGGIAIFLLPSVLMLAFGLITGWSNDVEKNVDFDVCKACITNPFSSDCHD